MAVRDRKRLDALMDRVSEQEREVVKAALGLKFSTADLAGWSESMTALKQETDKLKTAMAAKDEEFRRIWGSPPYF